MSEPSPGFPALAAILLAAGSSRRYGPDNKLLAQINGTPLIMRVATALASAGFGELIVVTGHDATRIEQALRPLGSAARFVHNPQHNAGMGRSVAAGVAALSPNIEGALIAPGDMPDIDAPLIMTLCQRFQAAGGDRITAPWITDDGPSGGRQGNPVVWPCRLFPDLIALTGDQGGKALIKAAVALNGEPKKKKTKKEG